MKTINIGNEFKGELLKIEEDSHIKIDFSNYSNAIKIDIGENITVKIFLKLVNTNIKLLYEIGENSNVIVDNFGINSNDEVVFNLNGENANIIYNTGIISSKNSTYKEIINHNFKNTISKVINHALNVFNYDFKFIIDGVIKENSDDSTLKQDNKIINLKGGKSYIKPNLVIDNNEVEANHSAYIGNFDEDIKFYMMSRGIKEEDTYDLLIKTFLLNKMSLYQKDRDDILDLINKEMEVYFE